MKPLQSPAQATLRKGDLRAWLYVCALLLIAVVAAMRLTFGPMASTFGLQSRIAATIEVMPASGPAERPVTAAFFGERQPTGFRPAPLLELPIEIAGVRPKSSDAEDVVAADEGYIIIGSFSTLANARRFAATAERWRPEVLQADVGGKQRYYVAVGPFTTDRLPAMQRLVVLDGVADAWPLFARDGNEIKIAGVKPGE